MDSQFCDARKAIAEDNEKSLLIFGGVRRREKEEKENNLYWALAVIADASSGELGPLPSSALMVTCPGIPGIPPSSSFSEE